MLTWKRVDALCGRLNDKIKEYDKRLMQLECIHVLVPSTYSRTTYHGNGFGYSETAYMMRCEKCKKTFQDLSYEEYLEAMLQENSKACKDERDKIKLQLEELREKQALAAAEKEGEA